MSKNIQFLMYFFCDACQTHFAERHKNCDGRKLVTETAIDDASTPPGIAKLSQIWLIESPRVYRRLYFLRG